MIVTGDPIGEKMAGPAIRAWNMAEQLSLDHEVRVVSFNSASIQGTSFEVLHNSVSNQSGMSSLVKWAEIIVVQGNAFILFPCLSAGNKYIVVDIYDPMHLEQLEQSSSLPLELRERALQETTTTINHQLVRGDFFLCASERQRDFWLGQLAALGRLNISNYLMNSDFRALIDVAPFGLPKALPNHNSKAIRGVIPGIGVKDKVVIWGGGIYDWFDPFTLIKAISIVSKNHPEIKLYFMGTQHPNKDVPEMEVVSNSRKLSNELGLTGRNVFFNESWVDYSKRGNFLLESDLGVSTHFHHIETRYSFRTRILDYLWAGLPIISTDGDGFGDLIREYNLGAVVPESDENALAEALIATLFDNENRAILSRNVDQFRSRFYWEHTLRPLVHYCSAPYKAGDRVNGFAGANLRGLSLRHASHVSQKKGLIGDVVRAVELFKIGGMSAVKMKIIKRMKSI